MLCPALYTVVYNSTVYRAARVEHDIIRFDSLMQYRTDHTWRVLAALARGWACSRRRGGREAA